MKNTSSGILFIILLLFTVLSCAPIDQNSDQLFFIRNAGADMPVWVKGNIDSKVFIIVVPGWPGLGLFYGEHQSMKTLGEKYAVVFYDCRGVGASKGNPSVNTMTMNQFTEDLDLIVDTIIHRYGNSTIFLMGHSLGGLVGSTYLTDSARQAKIRGWISVEAANNNPELMNKLRTPLITYAQNHPEIDYWKGFLDWANSHSNFTQKNLTGYIQYADAAGIITLGNDMTLNNDLASSIFLSPAGGLEQQLALDYMDQNFKFNYSNAFYIPVSELNKINKPSIVMKGNFSKGGMGSDLAQWEHDALGTAGAQKSILIFQNSGHHPFINEPDLFCRKVSEFIETYK